MDIVSHALLGRILILDASNWTRRQLWLVALFGWLPDALQIPLYLFVGAVHERPLWIPWNADWDGFRDAYPYVSWLWEMPHSFLFLLLVVTPVVLRYGLPRTCIAAYLSHILADILTHHGEWGVAPLFPFGGRVDGYWSAWDDSPLIWAGCWLAILATYGLVSRTYLWFSQPPAERPVVAAPPIPLPRRRSART